MADRDAFELRFAAAYRAYLDGAPEIDAPALARSVARAHPRRRTRWAPWPWRPVALGPVGWLILLGALLALIAGAIGMGAFRGLPGPYGLARPGLIAVDTKLASDISHDAWRTCAPDGSVLASARWHTRGARAYLAGVVDADGSHLRVPTHFPRTSRTPTRALDGARVPGCTEDRASAVGIDLTATRPVRIIPIETDQAARWQGVAP